jgi:uncharacterized phiE125 gp8 family phage protein
MKLDATRIKITTAPANEPVSLAEAKEHCRIDHDTEDAMIDGFIVAARTYCEGIAARSFVTKTYTAYLDCWPGWCIELPFPPLLTVTSIKYYDNADSAAVTFSASNYQVDAHSEPGRIALKSSASWPSVTLRDLNGVEIIYTAGYGDAEDVPDTYKAAIKLYVGDLYENREAITVGQGFSVNPNPTFDKLLILDRGGWN